jgi:O-antigen/teichoic acid export membrane protein
MTAPINRAVFPGYSKLSSDTRLLRQMYLDVTGLIAVIVLPAAIGIAAVADLLVPVVLGDKWLHVAPLVRILAWWAAVGCLSSNVGPLFNALSRPSYMTYLQIVSITLLLPSAYVLCGRLGVLGAGWAYVLSTTITTPLTFLAVMHLLHLRIGTVLAAIWRPLVAGLSMYAAVGAYAQWASSPTITTLLLAIAVGVMTYLTVLGGIWQLQGCPPGSERVVLDQLHKMTLHFTFRERRES